MLSENVLFAQEIIVELDYSDCRDDTHIGSWSFILDEDQKIIFVACAENVEAKPTIRLSNERNGKRKTDEMEFNQLLWKNAMPWNNQIVSC